jgi:hypothetical protein
MDKQVEIRVHYFGLQVLCGCQPDGLISPDIHLLQRQAHLLGHWDASAIVYTVENKFHREVLLLVNGVIECRLYEISSWLGHRPLAPNWII